jgi:acylphosphatase
VPENPRPGSPIRSSLPPTGCSAIIGAVNARAHLFVSGWVQGVSFRGYTRRCAQELALTGWVRNLYDGRVEAVVEGPRNAVEALIAKVRRGPSGARVEAVDVVWEEPRGEFTDFRIAWLDF